MFFYDILQRKNSFLGYKTRSFKSRKIDFFTNFKNDDYFNLIFKQYRQGNYILRYFTRMKLLSRL